MRQMTNIMISKDRCDAILILREDYLLNNIRCGLLLRRLLLFLLASFMLEVAGTHDRIFPISIV
jgi:hypothetical protein